MSAIEDPDLVLPGYGGALIAVRGVGRQQYLAVIYKDRLRGRLYALCVSYEEGCPKKGYMEKELLAPPVFEQIFQVVPYLTRLPVRRLLVDYDPEADVLYLSFERPQQATDSEMLDNGVLLR